MSYKRILFAIIATTSWIVSFAQAPITWFANPNFGHGYPMVTSVREWYINTSQFENDREQVPISLNDFIMRVNGKDVLKDNGLDEFNKSKIITIEYFSWPYDGVKSFTFSNELYNERNDAGDMRNSNVYDIVPLYRYQMPGMSIVRSKNIDFADLTTYDFLIEGNDPLVDEELLNVFMNGVLTSRMKRDTENPDVIFRIAKSTDQSFSATYIPPTQQVVGTKTTINPVYNYITRTTSYEARQKVNTIEKEGRTELTKVEDVYLEIVALDAKKLNDPKQTTPPEIWKMTYSSNEVNDSRTALKRYKDILAMCDYPFITPAAYMVGTPLFTGATLVPSTDKKSLIVTEVAPGSPAYYLGLCPGDKILKVNGKNEFKRVTTSKKGWAIHEMNVPLVELPKNIAEAVNYLMVIDYKNMESKGTLQKLEYKGLNSNKYNEFLIERNGTKIKLKGQLWIPQFLNMNPDTIRAWCLENQRISYILFPY